MTFPLLGHGERPVTDGRSNVSRWQSDIARAGATTAEQSQPYQQKSTDHGRERSATQRF